jgi:hypothetical protein
MDDRQFDTLVRGLAAGTSRRTGLRLLAGAGAALVAFARGGDSGVLARRGTAGPGDPCRHDDQCLGADAPLVCAWNGFDYDGDLNCCTYEGSRCGFDAACCGTARCLRGICTSQSSYASPGDPCQTTDQCQRPQTGAICEYTVSTGDSRCCWYEGSFCTSGAQCCGSRVCAGGVCQFMGGSSSGGNGTACTWEGCDCQLYRDSDCRASCPLLDPCDPGLVCTGTSEFTGTCVSSQSSGCSWEGCACYRGWSDADPCDQGLVCCLNGSPVFGGNGGCVPQWKC